VDHPSRPSLVDHILGRTVVGKRREIDAHLESCASCREAMEEARKETLVATHTVLGPELKGGSTIGRFEVLRCLGEGGMGAVYEAHDPLLDRLLAIKVLRGDVVTEAMHVRLLREAQALARLKHPNVVAVYDVGKSDERIFIAMDFVDGMNAAEWMRASEVGPRTWREVLDLYLRAGAGLAAAHDVGLVHRDFKPANLLVGRDGRVCVTDFGLVRLEAAADTRALPVPAGDITDHGVVMGSPGYMAPEQMTGAKVDAACDVFAFCVSLYEGLHGQRPFRGDTLGKIYAAVVKGELAPVAPEVPAWLQTRLVAGLHPDPSQRPTMRELVTGLEEERSIRQLARAERLLEEAKPLTQAAGGFARVASRLLRELVHETPRPGELQRAGDLGDVELSGAHAQMLLTKLSSPALASHFMLREGLGTLEDDGTLRFDPDAWYPVTSFVRAAHNLIRDLGPRASFHVGLFMRDRSGRSADLIEALRQIGPTYRRSLRWRGEPLPDGADVPGIGDYACDVRGPNEVHITASGPWPCEFDRALVSGVVLRQQPDAAIEHGEGCRWKGAPACVYQVRWASGVGRARLAPAANRVAFLADPLGRYLVGPSWIYWYLDPNLEGTIFRGRPSVVDLSDLVALWDALQNQEVHHGSLIDLRDVQEISPEVFAQVQRLFADKREVYGRRLQLALIRPAGMVGALITGALAMAGALHPFEFFDDESAALTWLGRHDELLVGELVQLRAT
jgi:hypothetical protein